MLQGLAVGVILHFVRDITDGGTIPLLWPLLSGGFSLPYPFYVLTLLSVPLLGIFVEPGTSEDDAGSEARRAGRHSFGAGHRSAVAHYSRASEADIR